MGGGGNYGSGYVSIADMAESPFGEVGPFDAGGVKDSPFASNRFLLGETVEVNWGKQVGCFFSIFDGYAEINIVVHEDCRVKEQQIQHQSLFVLNSF